MLYCYPWMQPPCRTTSLYGWYAGIFWRVAKALDAMRSIVRIEACVGEMHAMFDDIHVHRVEREAKGLTVGFDRIMMNNVPDYTGLLNAHLVWGNALKPHARAVAITNIMFNSGTSLPTAVYRLQGRLLFVCVMMYSFL